MEQPCNQNIKPANSEDSCTEKPSDQKNQSKTSSTSPNSKQKEKENAERLTRPGTLTKEEGMVMAKQRLLDLNFVLSPSQPDTLGEIDFQSLFIFFVMCNLCNKKFFLFNQRIFYQHKQDTMPLHIYQFTVHFSLFTF